MAMRFDLKEEIIRWQREYGTPTQAKSGSTYYRIDVQERQQAMIHLLERLKGLGAERDYFLGQRREQIAKACILRKETRGLSKAVWSQRLICALEDLDAAKVVVFGTQSDDIESGKQTKVTVSTKTETEIEAEQAAATIIHPEITKPVPVPKNPEQPFEFKEFDQSKVAGRELSFYEEEDEDFLALIGEKKNE